MDWPNLCILLLTYNRQEYAEQTLRSALQNIHYSGSLAVHIADDGSPPEYREHLAGILAEHPPLTHTVTNSERRGYGANYNLALQTVHAWAEVVLPLEDDWSLTKPLDLDPLVAALQEGWFDCLRLGYIGYTQPLKGEFRHDMSGNHYLLLDPDSPEPHVWAGHPRLETAERQRRVGPWQEGLDPGTTEFEIAHRPEARRGVVWPLDLIHPWGDLFAHIGTYPAPVDELEAVVS
jgi:glycosyltransferase involved in cell wall biosynthesis